MKKETTHIRIFDKESRSKFIDKLIDKLSEKEKKELNKLCLEIFRVTNLNDRKNIDKLDILLKIKEASYKLDGLLRLKKGYRHKYIFS